MKGGDIHGKKEARVSQNRQAKEEARSKASLWTHLRRQVARSQTEWGERPINDRALLIVERMEIGMVVIMGIAIPALYITCALHGELVAVLIFRHLFGIYYWPTVV